MISFAKATMIRDGEHTQLSTRTDDAPLSATALPQAPATVDCVTECRIEANGEVTGIFRRRTRIVACDLDRLHANPLKAVQVVTGFVKQGTKKIIAGVLDFTGKVLEKIADSLEETPQAQNTPQVSHSPWELELGEELKSLLDEDDQALVQECFEAIANGESGWDPLWDRFEAMATDMDFTMHCRTFTERGVIAELTIVYKKRHRAHTARVERHPIHKFRPAMPPGNRAKSKTLLASTRINLASSRPPPRAPARKISQAFIRDTAFFNPKGSGRTDRKRTIRHA
jgi:hypothetical protein